MERYFGLDTHDIQSIDAAKLYYSGLTQAQVAQRLHVARPTVSKLLAHAKRRGFVRMQVIDPREYDETLVASLTERFNLRDVVLVSSNQPTAVALYGALGRAGAKLLRSIVRDGDLIGVVPSRTLRAVAEFLDYSPRSGVKIVQVSNGLSCPAQESSEKMLRRMASAFNAQTVGLEVPTFSHSVSAQNKLLACGHIRKIVALINSARIIVYTVGDIKSDSALILDSSLSAREKAILLERSVGDICSRFIDKKGRICIPDLNNRTLGITLPQVRHMEQKILVAGGREKVPVIAAALQNGYVNRLVTDVSTARSVLRETD